MKQTINLIPPVQKIKLGFLSFQRMALLSVIFFISLAVFNMTLVVWREKIEHDVELIQSHINREKINLSELLRQESEMSKAYGERIEALEDKDTKIKGQLEAYHKISLDRQFAYDVLLALSTSHISDIWLNKINLIDESDLEIIGETKDPQTLTDLFSQWRKEKAFEGKALNIISLEKKQGTWSFIVSSRHIRNESVAGH